MTAVTRDLPHVLELRSVRGTGGGPEKTILFGAQLLSGRIRTTVCYIRDSRDNDFMIDERAAATGVDYVEVHERHSFDPAVWSQLRRLVRDRAIDIVHAHEYKTDALALALARSDGIVPLATAHGWTGHSSRERWLYYPADRFLLARYPRVIAVSSDIKNALVRAGANPARVTTILNGIDPRAFRRDRSRTEAVRASLGLDPGDVVIGAVGRLEPQKRFDLLLEAVATLRQRQPNLRIVIAGDGSLRADLERQASALFAPGVCLLLGLRTDITDLHHAFDIFVQSSDYEGTPNAVLEAMAMESPIVATSAGGTAELIEDGVHGLVVAAGDRGVLVRSIAALLADPAAAAARAAAARARVEGPLSFDARTAALQEIYLELMKGRSGATGRRQYAGRATAS